MSGLVDEPHMMKVVRSRVLCVDKSSDERGVEKAYIGAGCYTGLQGFMAIWHDGRLDGELLKERGGSNADTLPTDGTPIPTPPLMASRIKVKIFLLPPRGGNSHITYAGRAASPSTDTYVQLLFDTRQAAPTRPIVINTATGLGRQTGLTPIRVKISPTAENISPSLPTWSGRVHPPWVYGAYYSGSVGHGRIPISVDVLEQK
ncbi:hypothetical protein DFH09DRAFT_1109003 [Mycena vulgaris]|nr:hypothetical protein DFH09DRAFT_1109003 [Mycena vulgaris]